MKKKILAMIYCVLFFGVLLIPLVAMPFYQNQSTTEKRVLAFFPKVTTQEGKPNLEFFSELGDYFRDHFAFRTELVQADAVVETKLFRTSSQDTVILGRDGWLFYQETLDDYQGKSNLSDRELFCAVKNLTLMQEYVEASGGKFLFTIAPNKNTLYPENMPYYYKKISDAGDMDKLLPLIQAAGIPYADLKGALQAQDEVLYFRLDSHWNNQGAALAMETLLDALGKEHYAYAEEPYTREKNFDGDLYGMLYPNGTEKDYNVMYEKGDIYAYVGDVEKTDESSITTVNPSKEGSVVMYRDSFGNQLLPFVANEYANGYFTRQLPYELDVVQDKGADTFIFELAQRHLGQLVTYSARMPAPQRTVPEAQVNELNSVTCQAEVIDNYRLIKGTVPAGQVDEDTPIYINVVTKAETLTYEASLISSKTSDAYGYEIYLPLNEADDDIQGYEVLAKQNDTWIKSKIFGKEDGI